MYEIDPVRRDQPLDRQSVGKHADGVLARGRKCDEFASGGGHPGAEAARLREHKGTAAAADDGFGDVDNGQLRAAGVEARDDLQDGGPRFCHRILPWWREGFIGWTVMGDKQPHFLAVGSGASVRRIAWLHDAGDGGGRAGVIWLPGFKSEMTSTKASALSAWAEGRGIACLRFDYSGHGQSEGRFEEGTLSRWLEEACAVFLQLSSGPQILVGSSMGGHIALLLLRHLLAVAAEDARRIAALVLIAPAWDMTELMWSRLPSTARKQIEEQGVYLRPSAYGDGPYAITRALIEDGRRHLIGSAPFDPGRPVHILHGLQDPDVPWEHTLDLVAHLDGDWVRVSAIPDGEHRLSRPEDLAMLLDIVGGLVARAG